MRSLLRTAVSLQKSLQQKNKRERTWQNRLLRKFPCGNVSDAER